MIRGLSLFLISLPLASGAALSEAALEADLKNLAAGIDGRLGVCAQLQRQVVCVNPEQRFSLQSVIKLIVSAAVMDAVDRRGWKLSEPIVVYPKDLSLFMQPIADLVTPAGYRTTIGDLVRRAVVDSDSAAVDILLARLGGPAVVQEFLSRHRIAGMRVDRDEKTLQTEIVGIPWKPEFVDAKRLRQAIDATPEAQRTAAYRKYQTDVRDTATPRGMTLFLWQLAAGKLLSRPSTDHLIQVMRQTATFPDRLRAGAPDGWKVAHKTGTSGGWKGVVAATNDVGILTAPDGAHIAITAFVGDSKETLEKRNATIAAAARAVTRHYR